MAESEPDASRLKPSPSSSSSPSSPSSPHPVIALSARDEKLFDLLLQVARNLSPSPTLRVAGGWVRDTILLPHSSSEHVDIDIALDNMLGITFAQHIQRYLKSLQMPTSSIGLIQKNPEQSKHLETATMRVMDVFLDLVNLRTETYSHDSRIPNVEIGTPYEDAMRRDLTINSLFYNINTRTLEDFTKRGIHDIHNRIIRTPLPPLTTLLDDPLRALRAIRFASRLNFKFDEVLFEACRNCQVHEALGAKVSRERISNEIDRILACENAPHAIGLLIELGLFPIVFRLPPAETFTKTFSSLPELPATALGALLNLHSMKNPSKCPARRKLVRYAALLSPIAPYSCSYSERRKKNRVIPVSQYIMTKELRLSNRDVTDVCSIHCSALSLRELVHSGAKQLDRLKTGLAIRSAGSYWRSALQIALVMDLRPAECTDSYASGMGPVCELKDTNCNLLVETYRLFGEKVESMGLDDAWNLKPKIDGRELVKILPKLKRGPLVGDIMKRQVEWMIENPEKGSGEITQWLIQSYEQFR